MKKMISLVAMAAMTMALLVGCGKPASLEEAVENDEKAKAEIESMTEESGVKVDISGNTITYSYDLGMELDEDTKAAVSEQLESSIASYDSTFVGIAKTLEDETKLTGITVVVNYTDSNGNVVYSTSYNSTERITE